MVGPEHGVEGDEELARQGDEKVGAHGLDEGEQGEWALRRLALSGPEYGGLTRGCPAAATNSP
jgi:hypothetical protein